MTCPISSYVASGTDIGDGATYQVLRAGVSEAALEGAQAVLQARNQVSQLCAYAGPGTDRSTNCGVGTEGVGCLVWCTAIGSRIVFSFGAVWYGPCGVPERASLSFRTGIRLPRYGPYLPSTVVCSVRH
eukprot:1575774-Rhodomonas_salina.2